MKERELYNRLESMEDKDIQIEISASIIYLIKARGFSLRKILRDIKSLTKLLYRKEG